MKRAHQLYADAVSALLKLVAEQMDMSATDEQRLDCIGKMTDTFSLVRNALFSFSEQISQLQNQQLAFAVRCYLQANPRLEDFPLTYVSPGFSTLTGYASAEVLGRNCRLLQGSWCSV